MPYTIDKESKQRIRYVVDIEYMTRRYKTENELFTFPSPSLETIEKNLWFLLRNSKEVEFERKYIMRPDYLAFDEYGTVILADLLMYVNGVSKIEDFDLDSVVIPTYDAVITISKDKFSQQDPDDLAEVEW